MSSKKDDAGSLLIKLLTQQDWEVYKQLRLEALKNSPESFGSSYEEELNWSNLEFQDSLNKSNILGAFVDGILVACAGFYSLNFMKTKHRGVMWGMYTKPEYRGVGIASSLLEAVILYAQSRVLQLHLTVVTTNLGAIKLYQKHGFKIYGTEPCALKIGDIFFDEYLMVLDLTKEDTKTLVENQKNAIKIKLLAATIADHPSIQKMWPFYVYDLGRECGFMKGWECPTSPDFVPDDLTCYFTDPKKKPFLIKVDDELAGFVFISQLEIMPEIDFYLSELFILAKFQNKGIGKKVAVDLFNQLKGKWAVGILPENKKALNFWRKTIVEYTAGHFFEFFKTSQELKTAEHPDPYPMIILSFDTSTKMKIGL